MPRLNVILLDRDLSDGAGNTLHYVLWADVPAARQVRYADAAKVSVWKDAIPADNTALQSGAVAESVGSLRVPQGSTLPQIEGFLQQAWQNYQDYINNFNPWNRYGSTWDGTTWVLANNV